MCVCPSFPDGNNNEHIFAANQVTPMFFPLEIYDDPNSTLSS